MKGYWDYIIVYGPETQMPDTFVHWHVIITRWTSW